MKIEILYPEIANLYGDMANIRYLAECTGAEVINTHLKEAPKFVSDDIDLVYMGCTTEKGQSLIRDAFRPYVNALMKRNEDGKLTLFTGNSFEIFGEYIENEDGSRERMLGMLPIYAKRKMMNRYNSLYLGKIEDMEIIGFKSQFTHVYVIAGNHLDPLFETTRGAGLSPEVTGEGVRIGNFMATYVLGPILVMNGPFNKYIQKLMGITNPSLVFEEAEMDVYNTRLAEFSEPTRGFIY